ncbi:MAG: hypothetical protein IKZ96_02835 [Bacilli bacterium]|nr:hypothetical protein [Bacilli bacterium]
MSEVEEISVEKALEMWPELKTYSDTTLYVSIIEMEELKKSDKVEVDDKDINIQFIKNILEKSNYFEYASRLFNGDIDFFKASYIIYGDTAGNIGSSYTKTNIIHAIEKLIQDGKLELGDVAKERYEYLRDLITYDKFKEVNKGNNLNIFIDGNKYSIPIEQIFNFMDLPVEEYKRICEEDEYINGIPKEHFAYATLSFLKKNKSFDNYLVPQAFITRYFSLMSHNAIDTQAINRFLTTTDTIYQKVVMDEELKESILNGIPTDASLIEKAAYIYIKMCKELSYDEEYYAVSQRGPVAQRHSNVEYITTINKENNNAVCFEFNAMYSKFLHDLGIHFESEYKEMCEESYGGPHASLTFRIDKFLVFVDSVSEILNKNDMARVKLNEPLLGFKCINNSLKTQKEFKEAITKMYTLIAKQDESINKHKIETEISLEDLLNEYSLTTDNIAEISFEDRLNILIDKVNKEGLKGMDSFDYLLQLKRVLFSRKQKDNFGISIVRNNCPEDKSKEALGIAIIYLNGLSFNDNPEYTKYYLYVPDKDYLEDISIEELQSRFNQYIYEYIEDDDPLVPGIKVGGPRYD